MAPLAESAMSQYGVCHLSTPWNQLIVEQYLQYIRRQNPVVEGTTLSDPVRAVIIQAYDFALNDCGTDRASGEIWQDYLQFLSAPRVSLVLCFLKAS